MGGFGDMRSELITRLVDDIADARLVLYVRCGVISVRPLNASVPKPSIDLINRIRDNKTELIDYIRGASAFAIPTPGVGSSQPE